MVERLVYAHDHQLEALEEAAMAFLEENALLFHREAMPTLSVLAQNPLLLTVTGLLMAGVVPAGPSGAGAGGAGGAAGGAGGAAQT